MTRFGILLLILFSTPSFAQWQAEWLIGNEPIQERQRHSVFLQLLNDESITGVIGLDKVSTDGVFIEQTSNFWQYGTLKSEGKSQAQAVLRFDLYPSSSGEFSLPAIHIKIGSADNIQVVQTPEKRFNVLALPENAKGKIVSSKVVASQKVSTTEITAGGAVTRTLTLKVNDLPGHYISEIPYLDHIKGVTIRTGNSNTNTVTNRSELVGSRSTNIHYRFEDKGRYQLPAMHFEWWNTKTKQVNELRIDAVDVIVSAAPPLPFDQRFENAINDAKNWFAKYKTTLIMLFIGFVSIVRFQYLWLKLWNRLVQRIKQAQANSNVQSVFFATKILCSSKIKAKYHLDRWLSEQGIYDVRHHPQLCTALTWSDGVLDIQQRKVARVIIKEIKEQWMARYQLKTLN
ncbi:hypothetical protein RCJ22_11045 [Vibrio sp. FNV 38]|nr:hypothetical protein [Vibrio sp. FNV 38]